MKPDVGVFLETLSAKLLFEMAPQMQPPFMQGTITVIGIMLAMLREEWDRVAQRRVEENAAMRALFVRAAPDVGDRGLRQRLLEAAESRDASLRISDLDAGNDRLRRLLIELHAHVEEQPSEAARRIEAEIWSELLASTERRRFSLAPF
jgi:hypothetical protein